MNIVDGMKRLIWYAEKLRAQGKSEDEIKKIMTEAAKKIKVTKGKRS